MNTWSPVAPEYVKDMKEIFVRYVTQDLERGLQWIS